MSETSLRLVPAGAVLVAMYGATVGRLATLGLPATTNQAVCSIVADPEVAIGRYVYHALRSKVSELLQRRVGGAQPNISKSIIAEVELPIPSISEQRRVTGILDLMEEVKKKRLSSINKIDVLVQAVFRRLSEHQTGSRQMMLETALEEIIDYRGKSPLKASRGIPLITARNVKNGELLAATEFIAESDYDLWMRRGLPQSGDVVFTTEAPMGEVAQIENPRVALAQRLLVLRGKKSVLNNTFLRFALRSDEVRKQLLERSTGSTVRGIRQSEFRQILIRVPSIELQAIFATLLDKTALLKRHQNLALAKVDALFCSLQHRAFRGEL